MKAALVALGAPAIVAIMLAFAACRPVVRSPRAEARAAILAVANGVVVADAWCAAAAMRTRDVRLAETCTEENTTARGALLQAEEALDDGAMARAGCEAAPALAALASMARRPTGRLPPKLEDALIMSAQVAKNLPCKGDAAP